jgi:hypothetical protein
LVGNPTGLVKFPGAYNILDPGKLTKFVIIHNVAKKIQGIMMPPGTSNYEGLLKYVAPGPPVWTG